ncbi:thioredoxin family protein [Sphingorhabdus arenilitoris]|uniref:Thioredoxin family protein n=1 Tax=Sphingorhabdus arenilitoris TaxID=1490041 RepID=A0ABV8RE76_9SPHN
MIRCVIFLFLWASVQPALLLAADTPDTASDTPNVGKPEPADEAGEGEFPAFPTDIVMELRSRVGDGPAEESCRYGFQGNDDDLLPISLPLTFVHIPTSQYRLLLDVPPGAPQLCVDLFDNFAANSGFAETGRYPAAPSNKKLDPDILRVDPALHRDDMAGEPDAADHAEATPYDEGPSRAEVDANVDIALARAKAFGKHSIIVLGANWCHDSRALAGWLEAERFKPVMAQNFELVYVDAGMPQMKGQARNQHLITRFGGKKQKGTPYLMLISPEGTLLNRKDAGSWRNAASRSADEIYSYLTGYAGR